MSDEYVDGETPKDTSSHPGDIGYGDGETPKAEPHPADLEVAQVYPVVGKLTETAAALVKAADDLGIPQAQIVYTDGHYRVPARLADAAELPEADATFTPPTPPRSATTDAGNGGDGTGEPGGDEKQPTGRWSKDDLQAYATEHGIAYDDGDSKAALLDKINA